MFKERVLPTNEATQSAEAVRPRNLILEKIPEDQFKTISRMLVAVDMPVGMQLAEATAIPDFIYFPTAGLISVDALTQAGESVEVSVIGREGFSGVYGLLGHDQGAHSVVMQGPGRGYRIRTLILREEFLKGGVLAQLVHSFLYMQMTQMSHSVLCNRLHPIEARIARWMLTACDRMQTDSFLLTQEFLAQMLGSRRSTVTVAAGQLQREGLIDYSRGKVRVVDRPGLEAKACECYGIVRQTYDLLIGRDY